MRTLLSAILAYVSAFVISRHQLAMEVVALRQQLAVYKRKQPHPKLRRSERLFWVVVRQMWDYWSGALILVKPDTVVAWHRAGYRLFWRWRSRPQRVGRPRVAEGKIQVGVRLASMESCYCSVSTFPNRPCRAICNGSSARQRKATRASGWPF
jgi:putative transposase